MRMRKKKHGAERIAACAEYQIPDPSVLSALAEDPAAVFGVARPIHLEIGCGKGNFAIGMAEANPTCSFIAMEKISDVACVALEKAKATAERRPDNLRVLIGDAEHLAEWFPAGTVSRIYLNFSDPWPKKGYAKRRLTHRRFLSLYRHILAEGGELYLKTDNEGLFDFSVEEFEACGLHIDFLSRDFHKAPEAAGNIMTEYEASFSAQGMPIYCARVHFDQSFKIPEKETSVMQKPVVYFTSDITPEKVVELYEKLGRVLPGKVAIKLHSGEKGNQNFLTADFWRPVIEHVGGTVVECNTAYEGARNTTERHLQLLADHGWSRHFKVDLLDAEGPDMVLPIPEGRVIRQNYVGKDLEGYDSMLVLSHFKGHPMGGFGGALKQLSIGVASSYGKAYIHGAGVPEDIWTADHDRFLEAMADAASSVVDYFEGNTVYINVMKNLSVDCDCCAVAEDPCMADIGMLISADPVAIDQACLDLVYASSDPGRPHLVERIESRHGVHTVEAAAALGVGSREYELIQI